MNSRVLKLWVLIMILGSTLALATDDRPPTFQGRVLGMAHVQGFDHLTILTPGGETMRFRLGQAGTCRNFLMDGDQVRIRPTARMPLDGSPLLARNMKVRRTGASYTFRNSDGEMNQKWRKTRARDGSCGRTPGDGCPRDPQRLSGGERTGGSRGDTGSRGGGGARSSGAGNCLGGR